MAWAPGELERRQLWFANEQARIANRVRLEQAMLGDPDAYAALFANFEALVFDAWERRRPPDEDYEDSLVIKNQNI